MDFNRPDYMNVTRFTDKTQEYTTSPQLTNLYTKHDTWMFNPKGQTMRYEDAFDSESLLV